MIELSVSAPSECVFPMGARVELFGLQNLSMNGTTGTVVSSVNSEGRVGVDLGVQGVKNIKPDNLRWQQQAFQPVFNLPQQDFQVVQLNQLNPPQQAFQPMQLNPPQPNCQPMQLPMQLNSPQQALQPMQLNPPQKCPTQPHLPQQVQGPPQQVLKREGKISYFKAFTIVMASNADLFTLVYNLAGLGKSVGTAVGTQPLLGPVLDFYSCDDHTEMTSYFVCQETVNAHPAVIVTTYVSILLCIPFLLIALIPLQVSDYNRHQIGFYLHLIEYRQKAWVHRFKVGVWVYIFIILMLAVYFMGIWKTFALQFDTVLGLCVTFILSSQGLFIRKIKVLDYHALVESEGDVQYATKFTDIAYAHLECIQAAPARHASQPQGQLGPLMGDPTGLAALHY